MLTRFNPQSIEVKQESRKELASAVHLSLKTVAPYFSTATVKNFEPVFNRFVTAFPQEAHKISDLRPTGMGPGELLAWFIFDNIHLGGKNSSIDLLINGKAFAEMKGGAYTKCTHTLDDFKITKDDDPAVSLLLKDLDVFNETHRKITGNNLTSWAPGKIRVSTLRLWEQINLLKLAKLYSGPPQRRIYIPLDVNGDVLSFDEKSTISNWDATDVGKRIKEFTLNSYRVHVDSKTCTLNKIIKRWRNQVFLDYLEGKRIALVNQDTLQMVFFGKLTKEMLGLYRVGRNQPWARIWLP